MLNNIHYYITYKLFIMSWMSENIFFKKLSFTTLHTQCVLCRGSMSEFTPKLNGVPNFVRLHERLLRKKVSEWLPECKYITQIKT